MSQNNEKLKVKSEIAVKEVLFELRTVVKGFCPDLQVNVLTRNCLRTFCLLDNQRFQVHQSPC